MSYISRSKVSQAVVIVLLSVLLASAKDLELFTSNILKLNEYLEDYSNEFYIQKEIDKQFSLFNISLNIDLVSINNIEKINYEEPYPKQEFNEPSEYQLNTQMLYNSFRSGYLSTAQNFTGFGVFPYREDNKVNLLKQILVQKDINGNDVDFKFNINTIPFNSKLNAIVIKELKNDLINKEKMINAILNDYINSNRQFAFYTFDCQTIQCNDQLQKVQEEINKKFSDKILVIISDSDPSELQQKLLIEINRLINLQFDDTMQQKNSSDDLTPMFSQSFQQFYNFLKVEYFPKITQFKFESSIYMFESPLNFLMLKGDFKRFMENFYQAETLLQYSLKFHIDSMFTVKLDEDHIDHLKRKQEASYLMLKSFFKYMYQCVEILKEYDHLVAHDSTDCYKTFTSGCFFRKYGATIIGLTLLIVISVLGFKAQMDEVMKISNKKKI